MAKLGSRASFNGTVVENITAAKTLDPSDSGKVFIVSQGASRAWLESSGEDEDEINRVFPRMTGVIDNVKNYPTSVYTISGSLNTRTQSNGRYGKRF